MVSLLVDLGANPNDQSGCPSAWKNTLRYIFKLESDELQRAVHSTGDNAVGGQDDLSEPHSLPDPDEEHGFVTPRQTYIQILQILLAAGADPHVQVLDADIQFSLTSII